MIRNSLTLCMGVLFLVVASLIPPRPAASLRAAGFREDHPAKRPMTVEDLWKVKRVGPPTISPDGKWCAVEVTSYDIDKNDSTSDIWLLATDGKTQKQLTRFGEPGRIGEPSGVSRRVATHPKWSPDGKHIAFLGKRGEETQIYLISPDGGEARQLTKMPMAPSGIKWGADSKTIYWIGLVYPDTPDDESFKRKETEHRNAKSKAMIIDDAAFRYWDRWLADGKRPVVFAVDAESGKHKNLFAHIHHAAGRGTPSPAGLLSLPPYEPTEKDYDISPDGKELCFVADSAKEIGMDVNYDLYTLALDKPDAEPKNITPDNPANDTNPVYSPDGKNIAFLRQKIKFFYADQSRLMVYDRSKETKRDLMANDGLDKRFQFDRSSANPRWSIDSTGIYFECEQAGNTTLMMVADALARPLAIALFWPEPKSISPNNQNIAISSDNRTMVFLESTMGQAAEVKGADLMESDLTMTRTRGPRTTGYYPKDDRPLHHFNDALVSEWNVGKVENVTIKGADNRDVQMWLIFPPDFDPAKKWPLVQMVHGGPHSAVHNDFNFRWNPHLWAAQGYVVACVNFHGSTGFGQEFTDSITGDLGTKPMIDIMRATDWLIAQPYIDKDRLAAAGASYGGYMMAWLNGHTDRFKCYIDHAGVYNWHSMMASDIIKPRERALGAAPWGDLAKIDAQSPQRFAAHFKTPTLISHGEKDFRVPVTQGLEYYNTLRQKGVPTRLIYFPDENHWILKPQNSILWHKEVFAWLEKYVGKGATK